MRNLLLASIFTSIWLSSAFADRVELRNGDRITGEVLQLDNGSLVVKTEALGNLRVKWDAVSKITTDNPVHLVADGARVEATTVERQDGADVIVTSGDYAFSVSPGHILALRSDAEQLAYQQREYREQHPEFSDRWNGTVDAGLSAARGNADTTNVSLGLKGARTTDSTRLSVSFNSLLARSRAANGTTLTSANAVRTGLRYELNLTNRLFTFGFGNFESDRVQHLDLRSVYGGGAGLRLAQSERGNLDIFTGASMNQESFSTSTTPDRRTGELLFGQDLSYQVSSRTSFAGRLSVYPNMTTPGDYRAVLDTTASTKLNAWIGWQVTVSNVYVSNPAVGARTNDMLLSTGLRFSLGHERPFRPRATVVKFKNGY
ncbi:MAG TPA: DUF481 domain-containing protein [Terriglobales bacterium]|nr:DUF481 domain-containing protein [Terriglobales bacterium]